MIRLISFTDLSDAEIIMVLSWRNHPTIRCWMLHPHEISMEEHLQFIESLKNRSDKRYFLVQDDAHYLGVVDLNTITPDSAELGIYANPDMRGVGTTLMNVLTDYAFQTLRLTKLIANVFSDNEKAKRLYSTFNFTEITRITCNGREMICMERNNDNR